MGKRKFIIVALISSLGLQAQELDSLEFTEDNPVVAAMDSLLLSRWIEWDDFTTDIEELNVYGFDKNEVPFYEDSVYQRRLEHLDAQTPFPLDYNDIVQAYIELYAEKRRTTTSKVLGLAETYFPMFEEHLMKYDMPLEIKYLAIVESALNAKAISHAGAAGLWQFMYPTGQLYDLDVTSHIDERMDPYLATDAACQYLGYLYGLYEDWGVALAAYNAGPGNVNKAIRKSGDKTTYWEIRNYLPRETQGYVPAFIAVNYIMNYATEHNIYPREPEIKYFEYDTLHIEGGLELEGIAECLNLELELLEYLNPVYTNGVIPAGIGKMPIYLPVDAVGDFIVNEEFMRQQQEVEAVAVNATSDTDDDEDYDGQTKIVHKVRSGEYLGVIAEKYGCSVSDIQRWNGMSGTFLNSGDKLTIYVNGGAPSDDSTDTTSNTSTTEVEEDPDGTVYVYYTIQYGDTLWDIASRYDGVSVDDLRALNKDLDERDLKNGQRIKIKKKG